MSDNTNLIEQEAVAVPAPRVKPETGRSALLEKIKAKDQPTGPAVAAPEPTLYERLQERRLQIFSAAPTREKLEQKLANKALTWREKEAIKSADKAEALKSALEFRALSAEIHEAHVNEAKWSEAELLGALYANVRGQESDYRRHAFGCTKKNAAEHLAFLSRGLKRLNEDEHTRKHLPGAYRKSQERIQERMARVESTPVTTLDLFEAKETTVAEPVTSEPVAEAQVPTVTPKAVAKEDPTMGDRKQMHLDLQSAIQFAGGAGDLSENALWDQDGKQRVYFVDGSFLYYDTTNRLYASKKSEGKLAEKWYQKLS
jgi:hypothetical protein